MRGRKKRTLVIGILCCLLVFMGVGFAVARTTLNIGGTSTAINTWDVRIANVAVSSKSDDVTIDVENTTIGNDGVSANLKADFVKPGDYVTFEILVENNGSIDATLNDLAIDTMPSTEADKNLYIIESTMPENAKLEAGKSLTFTITITFNKDAEKLPEGDVNFGVSLDYSQGNIPEGGGNTPGGNEPEKDWDFEVDEDGTIIAYNYDLGTDVVVPATNYEGKEIKTITEQSFISQGNIDLYLDESAMKFYGIIREDNTIIVDTVNNRTAAEVVVDKTLYLLSYEECQGDSSCIEQYKSISYICKDKDTCYNYMDDTKTIVSISETAETMGSIYINPDPNVSPEESIAELKSNVKTLDLSKATNLTTVGDSAFYSAGLESVDFGENSNITSIGNSAFSNNSLTSVEIPASVEMIGGSAFSGNQIETLTLGTAIEAQNQLTKNNKYSLTKLTAGVQKTSASNSKLKSIGGSAFSNNKIKTLILPSSLENIGSSAFSNNQIIGELVLPSNLTTIGSYAFQRNSISKLNIPEKVTTIEYSAFAYNAIAELSIPKTVTSLGSGAFSNNPLQKLTIEQCTISICRGYSSGNNYFGNNIKSLTIESGEIGNYAFSSSTDSTTKLESLTLGEGVTSIGSNAFQNNAIINLNLPQSLTTIDSYAFQNNAIVNLNFPQSLTTIGSYAFQNNEISTIVLPESITTINASVFNNNRINQITISDKVTTISSNAFANNQITELFLPKNVTSISSSSFSNNPLEILTIEQCTTNLCIGAQSSGSAYFASLPIKNLTIQSGELGNYAFYSLNDSITKIDTLILGEGVTAIGSYAFQNNKITNLVLPTTLTTLTSSTFQNNPIVKLTIGNCDTNVCNDSYYGSKVEEVNVLSGDIPDYAFSNSKVQKVNIGDGVTKIGLGSFLTGDAVVWINSASTTSYSAIIYDEENYDLIKQALQESFDSTPMTFYDSSKVVPLTAILRGYYNWESGELIQGGKSYVNELNLNNATNLTTIGSLAFYNGEITNLTIPKSVTMIDYQAFVGNVFENLIIEKCHPSFCNAQNSGMENKSLGTQIKNLTIKSGEIGDYAFRKYKGDSYKDPLETLTLGEGVTKIGKYAFWFNTIKDKLLIPSTVTTIGMMAFAENQINGVVFAENSNLTSIAYGAFSDNQIAGKLELSNNLQSIGEIAFKNNQITDLVIPYSVVEIGGAAFYGNPTLTSILIKRTEEDFLANVSGNGWDSSVPNLTVTYDPSR